MGSVQDFLSGGSATADQITFTASDTIETYILGGDLITSAVYRDPAAWYHIVFAVDTTQATASNRTKLYVNGLQVTSFSTATYPSQNAVTKMNSAVSHNIGRYVAASSSYLDGYMAEVNFIDGQALAPTAFGAFNDYNVWQPKKYGGTYGTNGFYLPFTNNASAATLGNDFSGNSNTWTTNNISVTTGSTYDSTTDVPTLTSATAANFAVISPINSNATISGGNLNVTYAAAVQTKNIATISITGKIYFESTFGGQVGTNNTYFGVGSKGTLSDYTTILGGDSFAWAVGTNNSEVGKRGAGVYTTLAAGASSAGDIFMVAVDPTSGKIWFGKNGTWYASGNPANGTSPAFTGLPAELFAILDLYGASGSQTVNANFGQRPFTYTPPTGYLALNTFNL